MSYGPYGQAVPPPPKRGMSTGAKIGIGCGGCLGVFALGFVFLLVIGLLAGDPEPSTDTTTAASPEAAAESGAPEEAAAEEEPAAEESAVTMTATHAGTVGDTIDDTTYTAIDIVVVNESDESVDVNPINFTAVLADGTVVSDWADTVFADIDAIDAVTLQPGQRAEGQIAVVGEVDVASVEMGDILGLGDPVVAEVQ
ncbi:DUF4352 domain-containing protein [Nocardiopsis synnemataformans]|uniref:DUF4352 domain-containing protein n=1 Tax=Nocardiopsis synnemataformans TaxID=61305 RepID=UPI003EB76DB1